MQTKHVYVVFVIAVLSAVLLTACAGTNPYMNTPDEEGQLAGFWHGVWHGMIAPIALIISIFSKNVYIFDVFNTGQGYGFGFLFGIGIAFSPINIILRLRQL